MNYLNIRIDPVGAMSVDDLVVAVAFLGLMNDRIHDNGHDSPDSIKNNLRTCERELSDRLRDDKERRLAILKSQRGTLLSRSDKLKSVDSEIADLEAALNPQPVAASA